MSVSDSFMFRTLIARAGLYELKPMLGLSRTRMGLSQVGIPWVYIPKLLTRERV